MKYKKRGFTLIELLIVIGIIAILAAAVIVAINPGQQFAQARDGARESHINTLYNALISYQISSGGNWGELSSEVTPGFDEICNTNLEPSNCDGLADLSDLAESGHINQIPVDPQGGVSETADGTGYFIAEGSVQVVAENAETRFIGIGTTESEYADNGGNGESFICGETLVDERDENSYATVEIDDQCWMAENLAYLPEVEPAGGDYSETEPYYYVIGYEGYDPEEAKENTFYSSSREEDINGYEVAGVLYNWPAAMNESVESGAQGACPEGWYLPTDEDWNGGVL